MKLDLIYTYLVRPSEGGDYDGIHDRFFKTYKMFKPRTPHRLIVALYGGEERTKKVETIFKGLNVEFMYYNGGGFDMGCYLTLGASLDSDLVVGMNTQIHMWRAGWLERFVTAYMQHGRALFGFAGSYENNPHLRGPCMAFPPILARQYPHKITNRKECHMAEWGEWNLSQWAKRNGYPPLMVTWNEILPQAAWRKPANCFRRGDQSDMLVWDRHSLLWSQLSEGPDKRLLTKSADGMK